MARVSASDAGDGRRASHTATAKPARRLRRAHVGDARLWLGLALVVGSVVLGARLLGTDDDSVLVLRATRDLAVGSPVEGLVPVRVDRAGFGEEYLVEQPPAGGVLRWPITAGEFVPRSAVVIGAAEQVREVTVPVDPLHAPPSLQGGDLVDVWASPPQAEPGGPTLVLRDVTVATVTLDDRGIGGEIGVVLNVPAADVSDLVRASRSGVIDLVAVPVRSQLPRHGSLEAAQAVP